MNMTMTTPWICAICSKAFSRKGDLVRHNSLHTGIKPHRCEDCGKRFAQFSGLKTHRNVHTKARPFRCGIDDCKASFGDPSSCARHRKETHRTVGAFRCPQPGCKSSIKRRSAFKVHLKKHKLDPETIDINALAPMLLPRQPLVRQKSTLQPVARFEPGMRNDFIQNISHISKNTHPYYDLRGNTHSYHCSVQEFPRIQGESHAINIWYPHNETMPLLEMPVIPPGIEQLFTIDSPMPSPPELDHSVTPSPESTPIKYRGTHLVTSLPTTPSISPVPQSSQLYFPPPVFAGQKEVQWGFDPALYSPTQQGLRVL